MIDEIIAPLLTTEWGRRTGWGVMIVLLVLVVITFFQTIFAWYGDFVITRSHNPTIAKPLSSEAANLIAQIPNQHIFGQPPIATKGATLPITSLQLRLLGIIQSVPEKYSRVIISEAGHPGKVYKVGDTLTTAGVRVYEIDRDGVVLENGGRLEKLPLARPPLLFHGMPKPLLPEEKKQEGNE